MRLIKRLILIEWECKGLIVENVYEKEYRKIKSAIEKA